MLVTVKLGADFSRGCAHPAMPALISATHPRCPERFAHRLLRVSARVNDADSMSSAPFTPSGYEVTS